MLIDLKRISLRVFVGVSHHAHRAEMAVIADHTLLHISFPQTAQIQDFLRMFPDFPKRLFGNIAARPFTPPCAGSTLISSRTKRAAINACNFCIRAKNPDSRHLAVFEAPVDALSHASFQQRDDWAWDGHRLSLGGTSLMALFSFLERNPRITRVMLHLDSDGAGYKAMRTIKAELAADSRFKRIRVSINPPRGGKDYNDALLRAVNLEWERKQSHRRKADIFI